MPDQSQESQEDHRDDGKGLRKGAASLAPSDLKVADCVQDAAVEIVTHLDLTESGANVVPDAAHGFELGTTVVANAEMGFEASCARGWQLSVEIG